MVQLVVVVVNKCGQSKKTRCIPHLQQTRSAQFTSRLANAMCMADPIRWRPMTNLHAVAVHLKARKPQIQRHPPIKSDTFACQARCFARLRHAVIRST